MYALSRGLNQAGRLDGRQRKFSEMLRAEAYFDRGGGGGGGGAQLKDPWIIFS
jgi:hypothetical protein